MKLNIHETFLLRIPSLPVSAVLSDELEKLKLSIELSSLDFHSQIEHLSSEHLNDLPISKMYTLWKYFNRSKYRPVPFAAFAGVGLSKLAGQKGDKLIICNKQSHHNLTNWPDKDLIETDFQDIINDKLSLIANSSYYIIKDSIRYLYLFEEKYQLSSIELDATIILILKHCAHEIQFSSLQESLFKLGFDFSQIIELIRSLTSCQLLFSSRHPNIIGEDYFNRIGYTSSADSTKYLLSERKVQSGNLSKEMFKNILPMVDHLHSILPPLVSVDLESFIRKFQLKFGEAEVPIMLALDPEIGIGYGQLEALENNDELASQLSSKKQEQIDNNITKIKSEILHTLNALNTKTFKTIDIKDLVTKPKLNPKKLPNTFSVLISLNGDKILVESIGGSTANGLLGRFSLMGNEYLEYCKQIAEIEQIANPNVLFFDVGYCGEKKIDNVNRRGSIYHAQLNIHNFDTSPDPLSLTDIMITVKDEQLILRSKKLNKRLIPKIASAYNYQRSDLSVFRLLCDLQHQGLQTSLNFDLQSLLPELPYYPRITYENLILFPAKWKIDVKDIKGSSASAANVLQHLSDLSVCQMFKTGVSDQTLCFDTSDKNDLKIFIHHLNKYKCIYIQEASANDIGTIKDQNDLSYNSQIVLSLFHTQPIYKDETLIDTPDKNENFSEIILPGNEWIYYEIYCHPFRVNDILSIPISVFLTDNQEQIINWHFLRYNENGSHIRLRLQLKDRNDSQTIVSEFSDLLKDHLVAGTISDLMIKTYKREMVRYRGNHIEDIESYFHTDSLLVIELLSSSFSVHQHYQLIKVMSLKIKATNFIPSDTFFSVVESICRTFEAENDINTIDRKAINTDYKQFTESNHPSLSHIQTKVVDLNLESFISILFKYESSLRPKLFTDLLHLHFNRLFQTNQRQHEMVFYQFLLKTLKTEKHHEILIRNDLVNQTNIKSYNHP
jgi:thiopeptide-type bacteriocin biosynthesis protein